MTKIMEHKKINLSILMTLIATVRIDQPSPEALGTGLTEAAGSIKNYMTPVVNLTMAIGGIVGIIGGIRIYQKWNTGDQDINKELMGWGGSALFLIIAPIVINAAFNL